MATMNTSPRDCAICREEYNDEGRCPRIFPCFHTLCTSCITKLIKNDTKDCPFCRKRFKADNATDIMINHSTMELVKYISSFEGTSEVLRKSGSIPRLQAINNFKARAQETSCYHQIDCEETQKQIAMTINEVVNLQKDMKEDNAKIEGEVLPKIQEIMSQNNDIIEDLEKKRKSLHSKLVDIKGKSDLLDTTRELLEIRSVATFKETADVLDGAEETNFSFGEWMKNVKEIISVEKKKMETTAKKVERTNESVTFVTTILTWRESQNQVNESIGAMSIQQEDRRVQITIESLRKMSQPLRYLLEQGKIYAIQQHEGKRRSAKMVLQDDKMHIHHLKDLQLPPNVLVIEFQEVMQLVDPSSRVTFLELADATSYSGRLYVQFNSNTKRAQQFSLLCSGETGVSYVGTRIQEIFNKNTEEEFVTCGDYENKGGEGGKAIVPTVWLEYGGVCRRPWLAGLVERKTSEEAAQFDIQTGNSGSEVRDAMFGRVEIGLHFLTEAIVRYRSMRNVFICDSGIVVPLSKFK